MISGFNKQTAPLCEYEREKVLPIMVKCLERHIDKDKAITNAQMCQKMKEYGYSITETRVRKIINHIRNNDLVKCLKASSKGYYVATDKRDMQEYIESLDERIAAIQKVRDSIFSQMKMMPEQPPTENELPPTENEKV